MAPQAQQIKKKDTIKEKEEGIHSRNYAPSGKKKNPKISGNLISYKIKKKCISHM